MAALGDVGQAAGEGDYADGLRVTPAPYATSLRATEGSRLLLSSLAGDCEAIILNGALIELLSL